MSNAGEIVQIHIGQAGVQIAKACWELYCIEHRIRSNGCLDEFPEDDSYKTFFSVTDSMKVEPRVVIIDTDPTFIDEIRTGCFRHLFKADTLLRGTEDCASNFGRGYYAIGSELIDVTVDAVRKLAEVCKNLKGFLIFRAIGGGTGSGLGQLIMENIHDDYSKISNMEFIIFPSPTVSPLIVEPYNAILSTHYSMDVTECSFVLDNEALYNICAQRLDVFSPTYINLNRIIGQVISSFTTSQRYFSQSNVSFDELQTNLVPYPRIHFPLISYAPLTRASRAIYGKFSTEYLTRSSFKPSSQLVQCNPDKGKYMACVLLYRGDIRTSEFYTSIDNLRIDHAKRFVDWSPTGFKFGVNATPPCCVEGGDLACTDRSLLNLTNCTAVHETWSRLMVKFNKLLSKRTFIHHYAGEGIEEDAFNAAGENVCALIHDYQSVEDLENRSLIVDEKGEIIHLHVGQAGVQIANACWELYCLEHGIQRDGALCEFPCDNTYKNFFTVKDTNKVVPRAVLVDAEPTVIDQVRTGPFGRLFSPQSLITGKEDSGSNFARGYYTTAPELIEITMEAIRYAAESSSSMQGFMTFRSIGGGTGSGLGNAIAERIQDDYDKVSRLEFVIFPSPSMSPLIVEPYNAVLATHMGMDTNHCSFVLDNEALYDICESRLNVCAPKYTNLNRIIGQAASTFTTSQRFGGTSNMTFLEIETNLVPYPRIHFPLVSFAPFISGHESGHTNLTTEQITAACFEPSCQLVRCNPSEGKYMACVLLYRGSIVMADVNYSLSQLRAKDTVQFVDWSPTGFKVGLNKQTPFSIPGGDVGFTNKSLVTLSNNTVISAAWCRVIRKYEHLYSRRAFIHHYVEEGLEEESLKEASDDIYALIADYKEVDQAGPPTDSSQYTTKANVKKEKSDLSTKSVRSPKKPGNDMPKFDGSKIRKDSYTDLRNKPRGEITRSEIPLPQLPGLQSKPTPRNNPSKSPTRRPLSDSGESADEISMPQLPGLQSLNYFFCEACPIENADGTKSGRSTFECEVIENPNQYKPSSSFRPKSEARPQTRPVNGKQKINQALSVSSHPCKRMSFEQGLETEACRARDKFCSMPKPRSPRCEKSAFCLTNCEQVERKPPRYYQIASNDPCATSKPSKCQKLFEGDNYREECPCRDCEKEPHDVCEREECLRVCCSKCAVRKKNDGNCFCCTGNDEDPFANDDRVVTVCCRPPMCRICKCICTPGSDDLFDVAGTKCPCSGSHIICCKDEESSCPCEDRVCECCPETTSLGSVLIRQSLNFGDDNGKTVCVKFQKKNK